MYRSPLVRPYVTTWHPDISLVHKPPHILRLQDAEMVPAFKRNSFGSGSSFMGPGCLFQRATSHCVERHTQFSGAASCGGSVPRWELSSWFNQKDNLTTENWLTELNAHVFVFFIYLFFFVQNITDSWPKWSLMVSRFSLLNRDAGRSCVWKFGCWFWEVKQKN